MDFVKPLLVAAPLLLALLWLGWRWARGRALARPQLNALFSLLLLLYLVATAGLGLFWVARQQLPVFDWHYLAGYLLLVLVAIHLGFNTRQLLRQLGGAVRPSAQPRMARRVGLRWAGAALLAGAAYVLGRRHSPGPAPPPQSASEDGGWQQLRDFHHRSAHRRGEAMPRLADWARRPPPFKQDPPDWPRRSLREAALAPWSRLLWQAVGIRERQGGVVFRHSPSSGALFPVELYLLLPSGPAAGIWRVDAEHWRLVRQPGEAPAGDALIVATAVFARSGHKYGERCYRYVLADLGHVLENLLQAGSLFGQPMRPLAGFDGAALAKRIGLDETQEGVLAVLAPGRGAAAEPIWRSETPLPMATPLTPRMHRAGALRAELPTADGVALPPATLPAHPGLLERIAARRSRRRFSAQALTLDQVAALLDAVGADEGVTLSQALQLHLLSHAVDGLAAGAWRWVPGSGRLLPTASHGEGLRSRSRAAALDQDVIGDAALVWVWSVAPVDLALEPLGVARAYRHALIETGRASQRLYLAAESLGLGVCAVGAFYDDELLALLGDQGLWPLHLAAVGGRRD